MKCIFLSSPSGLCASFISQNVKALHFNQSTLSKMIEQPFNFKLMFLKEFSLSLFPQGDSFVPTLSVNKGPSSSLMKNILFIFKLSSVKARILLPLLLLIHLCLVKKCYFSEHKEDLQYLSVAL